MKKLILLLLIFSFSYSYSQELDLKRVIRYDTTYNGAYEYEFGLEPASTTAANYYIGTNGSTTFGFWVLPNDLDSLTEGEGISLIDDGGSRTITSSNVVSNYYYSTTFTPVTQNLYNQYNTYTSQVTPLRMDTIVLSYTDILNLHSTPKKLIDAPDSAGTFIDLITCIARYDFGTTQFLADSTYIADGSTTVTDDSIYVYTAPKLIIHSSQETNRKEIVSVPGDTNFLLAIEDRAWKAQPMRMPSGRIYANDSLMISATEQVYDGDGSITLFLIYAYAPGDYASTSGTVSYVDHHADSVYVTGTTTKTINIRLTDESVLQGSFTDIDTDTDTQDLSFSNPTLSLVAGGSVDLSALNTDEQTLSISNDSLIISNGNSIDISSYLDNTDTQTLSLVGNTLSVSGGNNVSLAGYAHPAGAANYTIRHNGTSWDSTSLFKIYSTGEHYILGNSNTIATANIGNKYNAILASRLSTISGVYDTNNVIVGGYENEIGTYTNYSIIAGGYNNYISALNSQQNCNAILGGKDNIILLNYSYTSILGGYNNAAQGSYATVIGGQYLKIGSGSLGFRGGLNSPSSQYDASSETNTVHFKDVNFKQHDGATYFKNIAPPADTSLIFIVPTTGQIIDGGALSNYLNTGAQTLSISSNTLTISGGNSVDLNSYLDNTDTQDLSFSSDTLYLTDGGSVYLGAYLDDTDSDEQTLSISNDSLIISNGNSIDISSYLDNTDTQDLSFSNDTLYLVEGGSVYLGAYLDDTDTNTDEQDLSISNDTLYITNGDYVYLGAYLDNTDTQDLSFSNDTLYLVAGGSVYLGGYLDNTDAQTLDITSNNLSISNGNSVSLASYLDNTDTQTLALSSNTLSIQNANSVDLTAYLDNTDTQDLSISNDTLYLVDGGDVYLGEYLDNTDAQTLSRSNDTLFISNGNSVDLSDFGLPVPFGGQREMLAYDSESASWKSCPGLLYWNGRADYNEALILELTTDSIYTGFRVENDGSECKAASITNYNSNNTSLLIETWGGVTDAGAVTYGAPIVEIAKRDTVSNDNFLELTRNGTPYTWAVFTIDKDGYITSDGLKGSGDRNIITDSNGKITASDYSSPRWRGVSASAPSSPVEGDLYFNSSDSKVYIYANSSWRALN